MALASLSDGGRAAAGLAEDSPAFENAQAGGLQLVQHAPDPLGSLVVDRSGEPARHPQHVTVRGRR